MSPGQTSGTRQVATIAIQAICSAQNRGRRAAVLMALAVTTGLTVATPRA